MRNSCLIALILTIFPFVPIAPAVAESDFPLVAQRAVLVTGASTGIGRKITERLAAKGYWVYAGARKESDLQSLAAIHNVQAVRLDVTKAEEIVAAVDIVSRAGRGLYGLVNNAGVVTVGSLVDTTPEEFDLVMQVNVYGPYRITKAFAPLITAQKGRIVTIGSNAGILAFKDMGAYCMSKHAMEAFTDSLAQEMEPVGVHVSVIEPGGFRSEIFATAAKRVGQDPGLGDTSQLKEPTEVAAAVELALFAPAPKRRYLVVSTKPEAEATLRKQITQLVELNEGQEYTLDRKGLIQILDAALVRPESRIRSQRTIPLAGDGAARE